MISIFWQTSLAAIAGGLISLDRTAAFQLMISRPIVTCPLIGLVFGSPMTGAFMGAMLELLWIGDLPVGGHVPPHETGAAVIATAVAVNTKGIIPEKELLGICILMVIPFAVLCQKVDEGVRRFNSYYYNKALASIENGTAGGVGRFNMMAVLTLFAVNSVVFLLFIVSGVAGIRHIYYIFPKEFGFAFAGISAVIPIIGIASAFNTASSNRGARGVFFIMFILFIGLLTIGRT